MVSHELNEAVREAIWQRNGFDSMINIRSKGFRRYFANTSWMMAEKVIRMVVSLFVVVYVARYLGPEKFGLLSYAISFVGLFSAIATLGLDGIVIRNLVQEPERRKKLLGTSFTLKLIGALLLFVLVFMAVQMTSSDKFTKALVLIIAAGMIFQSFNVIDFYFQSQVLAKFTSCAQLCSLFISSGTKLGLIAIKASLVWFAWVVVLENAILAMSLIFMHRKQGLEIFQWRFEKHIALELLRDSWPLLLAGMAIMVYMRIDQVMIKEMLDSEAVGNYAAAVRLSEAWYFIPMAVSSSLFPAIINAKKVSKDHYRDKLQKLYDLMVWLAIAIAVPTTFLAKNVIILLFGDQYHLAAGVLKIHIWAGVFVFLGVASSKWFLAENLQHYSFYRTLAGAIVNVILNLVFIPKIGINGAAFATVISYFTAAYLSMAFFEHSRENFWLVTKSFDPISANKRIFHV